MNTIIREQKDVLLRDAFVYPIYKRTRKWLHGIQFRTSAVAGIAVGCSYFLREVICLFPVLHGQFIYPAYVGSKKYSDDSDA